MSEPSDIVGGLLVRNGRLLLGRRSPDKRLCPNAWDLLGGHVETGETEQEALVRELQEEIGVRPTRFERLAAWRFPAGARFSVYLVHAWSGGEPAICNPEHTALGWFTVEAACALTDLAAPEYRALFQFVSERFANEA
jgi:8-oxo-dGTP diphosphatase